MKTFVTTVAWTVMSLASHAAEIVIREGSGDFARQIAIAPPDEAEFEVSWYFSKKDPASEKVHEQSGTAVRFTGGTVGAEVNPFAYLSRQVSDGRNVYQLSLKESPYHRYEIRLGRTIYTVTSDSVLGLPPSKPAPPPIVWTDFEVSEPTTFSTEVRTQIAEATVRVTGASGFGTGTIVRGIAEQYPELFSNDEAFVLSAVALGVGCRQRSTRFS